MRVGVLTTSLLAFLWGSGAVLAAEAADCAGCHEELVNATTNQIHMRIRPFEVKGHVVGCEGCHGKADAHAEDGDASKVLRMGADKATDKACLACHSLKGFPAWNASTHAAEDLHCTTCHSIHKPGKPAETCAKCHGEQRAQFELPSHHPLREGKMTCMSCHEPHAATESQLKTKQRLNDLCTKCHQAQEGPYVFEHDPVQESCATCHVPHGSVAGRLLTANEPMLCLQCHEFHFHTGYEATDGVQMLGGIPRQSPNGPEGMNMAFSTKCTQCHPRVHGSDLPSQGISSNGKSLTR